MAPLRIPVKISESYVRSGSELALFPNVQSFLTASEVAEAWPGGVITHEQFTYQGLNWRLHQKRAGGASSPLQHLAVLDGDASALLPLPSGTGAGQRSYSTPGPVPADTAASGSVSLLSLRSPTSSPCSRPLHDLDFDAGCSPPLLLPSVKTLSATTSPHSSASAGNWLAQQQLSPVQQQRHLSGSTGGMVMAAAQSQNQHKFIEDLLTAESSHNALERYKALIRLMSALKRRMAQARISQPHKPQSWESQENQDVLKQIVMVGECLARFGTAEFSERSNSSRAINTKDYATLLTQYLEAHGAIFAMEFIAQLPQTLQDEVLTVRSLLQTRCEANSILFAQLVKHVGMEGQGNGQAVVYNTSLVTANPTSISTAAPKTLMQVAANAWSKATEKRSNRIGMMAAAAVVGLLLLKGRLPGGGGGRRGSRRGGDSGDGEYEHGGRARRGGYGMSGGALGLAERMLETRALAERAAVAHVVACHEELARAQHNTELLANDWRMGQLRLAGGSHPPGYQPVDASRCSLHALLQSLDAASPAAAAAPPPQRQPRAYSPAAAAAATAAAKAAAVAPPPPPPLQAPQQHLPVAAMTESSFEAAQQQPAQQQQQKASQAAAPAKKARRGRNNSKGDSAGAGAASASDGANVPWTDVLANLPTALGQFFQM